MALGDGSVEDLQSVEAWIAAYAKGTQDRPLVIDAKIASDDGSWWLAEAFRGTDLRSVQSSRSRQNSGRDLLPSAA